MKIQLLLVLAATICCSSGQVDYQPISEDYDDITRAADCEPGAFSCSDNCLEVIFCSSNGPVTVDTCSSTAGTVCSTITHQCVTGTECEHPPTHGPITCNALGYFPDPVFCEDYHVCPIIGYPSLLQTCTSPSAYNPLTTLCSLTQSARVCEEGPIPTCQAPGDVGPQQENPNIYYVCVKSNAVLHPELYKCPSNEIFVDNKCQLSSTVTTIDPGSSTATSGSTSSASTATTTPTTSTSTTTESTTTQEPTTTLEPTSTQEPTTTPEPTSTQEPTTTLEPTSTQEPTTSPEPTTTPKPTTTPVPTTTPYSCPGVGQYPDPLDCHWFYLCFEDLQSTHFPCGNEFYFHSSERGCIRGDC